VKRLLPLLVVQLLLSLCLLAAAGSAHALSFSSPTSAPLATLVDEEEADSDDEAEDSSESGDEEEEADDELCEADEEEFCEEEAEPKAKAKGKGKGKSGAAPGRRKAHKRGHHRGHHGRAGHHKTSASQAAPSGR